MLRKNNLFLFLIFLLIIVSCNQKLIILAEKDAFLSSLSPDINFSGKKEALKNFGYGVKKDFNDDYITYPSMYIGNTDNEIDSFIAGGFNFNIIKGKIKHASLKFFINYASNYRKNICIKIIKVIKEWEEDKITFNDIYEKTESGFKYKDVIEPDYNKHKIIVFNIKKNEYNIINKIPFKNSYKTVSVDVTNIINEVILQNNNFYGFLIEPLSLDDTRYITADYYNVISDYGIIEIASSEWRTWDGVVPYDFYLDKGKWINIQNKAKAKIKYLPRLEIIE